MHYRRYLESINCHATDPINKRTNLITHLNKHKNLANSTEQIPFNPTSFSPIPAKKYQSALMLTCDFAKVLFIKSDFLRLSIE